MANLTKSYETVFVLSNKLTEEATAELVKKFTDLIAANGTIESVDEWGKRRLAYEIDYEQEGYYVLVNFTAAHEFPAELDRIYKITDGVLRSLIVNKACSVLSLLPKRTKEMKLCLTKPFSSVA